MFVRPGGTLVAAAHVPGCAGAPTFELLRTGHPSQRYLLAHQPDATGRLAAGEPVALDVPAATPRGTYDLRIEADGAVLLGRHCVAVGPAAERIRLIHLSNMNIGEVDAPTFDRALVDEINLLAPTLIVATGDFLDATHSDLGAGWRELVDFLCAFDAPVLAACGDHDDLGAYCQHIAPTPVGIVDVGDWRGAVLFDLPGRPISRDVDQMRWLEVALTAPGEMRPTFVVAHDDCPNLLKAWQARGELNQMIQATRLGLWFAGGHRDWDGREYMSLIEAAQPMLYVRTHQSSPAMREGGDGVSHYRIVDLLGGRAYLPGDEPAAGGLPPSIPVGRLRVFCSGPSDGSRQELSFTAVNGHPFALDHLTVRLILAEGERQPWCIGGQLESATKLDRCWDCRVTFDLPDKGVLRALAGTGPQPVLPELGVTFDATARLLMIPRDTPDGLSFLSRADGVVLVHLHNRGSLAAEVTPLLRLDGQTLPYVVLGEAGPAAAAYRLRLSPGSSLTLQPDLNAITVTPGRRQLQVYLKGLPAWRPACQPLEIVLASARTAMRPAAE